MLSAPLFAGGNGPAYTYKGFGLFPYNSSTQMNGTGGAGLAVNNSSYINIYNPAQWLTSKTTRIQSHFSYEGITESSISGSSNYLDNVNFDGLLFTFPIKDKMALGFGISPYSLNNYSIKIAGSYSGLSYNDEYFGSGGLSKFTFGAGLKFSENLNFGLRVDYIHGSIDKNILRTIPSIGNASDVTIIRTRNNQFSGAAFSLSSFALLNENWLKSDDKLFFSTVIDFNSTISGTTSLNESSYYATDTTTVSENAPLKLPFGIKFGIGYHRDNNLVFAMDFIYTNTSELGFEKLENEKTADQFSLRSGFAYTPDFSIGATYLNKMTYKGGFYIGQSSVIVQNKKLDEFGFTAGLSLPLTSQSSSLELSGEFGLKGYIYDSPIKDKMFKIRVGINLSELWFQERIID